MDSASAPPGSAVRRQSLPAGRRLLGPHHQRLQGLGGLLGGQSHHRSRSNSLHGSKDGERDLSPGAQGTFQGVQQPRGRGSPDLVLGEAGPLPSAPSSFPLPPPHPRQRQRLPLRPSSWGGQGYGPSLGDPCSQEEQASASHAHCTPAMPTAQRQEGGAGRPSRVQPSSRPHHIPPPKGCGSFPTVSGSRLSTGSCVGVASAHARHPPHLSVPQCPLL